MRAQDALEYLSMITNLSTAIHLLPLSRLRSVDQRSPRGAGNKVGAMLDEIGAHPAAGLVQARPRRSRPSLAVAVIPQNDGASLPGGKLRHRGADGVRAVDILRRWHPVTGSRVQWLWPVRQQRGLAATPQAVTYVGRDARQPGCEPVRVAGR